MAKYDINYPNIRNHIPPLTKYGRFMYNLCMKTGKFLYKHRWLHYLLIFTWGLFPMPIIGLLVSLFMLITGHKPNLYYGVWYFETKWIKWWGGLELGCCFCKDQEDGDRLQLHEFGHLFQVILGPLFIFLVWIPSAISYWHRRLTKRPITTWYSSIWFERCAENLGSLLIKGELRISEELN